MVVASLGTKKYRRCSAGPFPNGSAALCLDARTPHHRYCLHALNRRSSRRLIDFSANGSLARQAEQFRRAAVVVGPYGAGLANIIFCQDGATVVEFVAAQRRNVLLFAGLARVFGFEYWVVLSNASDYSRIEPGDVTDTVGRALEHMSTRPPGLDEPGHRPSGRRSAAGRLTLNSEFLLDGYGKYHKGRVQDKFRMHEKRVGW